jgi:hypothetical protein
MISAAAAFSSPIRGSCMGFNDAVVVTVPGTLFSKRMPKRTAPNRS